MNNYTNDAVTLLRELIAIPSVSRSEDEAADKLGEYLNLWGLPYGREGNNLWVGCQDWDNNRKTVMLNAHIDTVKPVNTWTRDPFLVGFCRGRGVRREWSDTSDTHAATH